MACETRPGPCTTLVHFYPPTPPSFLPHLQCPPQTPPPNVRSFFLSPFLRDPHLSFSAAPSINTSLPSSPNDLRLIISSGALTPQKDAVRERKVSAHASQHLGLRVGSRSPTSIPSSPTSVYVIHI